jgi:hypothetical protein
MLGSVMAQIGATPAAEENAVWMEETGLADLALVGPARRAVGGRTLHLAGAPHGHGDGDGKGGDTTSARDEAACYEDVMRIGVESKPPPKEGRW